MISRSKLLVGLSALAAGGTLSVAVATQGFALSAFASDAPNARKAAEEAKDARKALAKRKADKAVAHAEAAVANAPQNAEYRALLGQAYLLAGRFTSASQALADALTLDPEDGRVALNLVLARIATGDWAGARATLNTHADHIPASDRGLAFALAGDPVTAVDILSPAAREAEATAKTRQNLALSLALAGRWAEARSIAAIDVSPDQLDNRIREWAHFSRPTNAYDQVASLLGVNAVQDGGQPAQLALVQQSNVMVAAATAAPAPDPVDAYMPGAGAAPEAAPAPVEAVAEAAPEPEQVAGTGPQVVFGPREEIVQAIPASAVRAPARAAVAQARAPKAAPVAQARPSRGSYYVQLGAYNNSAVARDAWKRLTGRVDALSGQTPHGAKVSTRAGNFYRLSVGGYARADADALCRQIKAGGQTCFVRAAAGDAMAAWAKPGREQVASR